MLSAKIADYSLGQAKARLLEGAEIKFIFGNGKNAGVQKLDKNNKYIYVRVCNSLIILHRISEYLE